MRTNNNKARVVKKANYNPTETLSVEKKYIKMDEVEHVLQQPGMYIGSITSNEEETWAYVEDKKMIDFVKVTNNQGLVKIYDEIVVNSRDQFIRDPTCNTLKVNINPDNSITVYNNGEHGIEIQKHQDLGIWIPQFLFSDLRVSSSYYQTEKVTGGKHGLGAKCTNIFSKRFIIDICDNRQKKTYYQEFSDNLDVIAEPDIKSYKGSKESYCSITFYPDYERFGLETLTTDIISVMKKRVFDIAGHLGSRATVLLNDEDISMKSFKDYVSLYYESEYLEKNMVYKEFSDLKDGLGPRWKVGLVFSDDPIVISFVNSVYTFNGGSHVKYIIDQAVGYITNKISSKNKTVAVKPAYVKECLSLFLDSTIADPDFSSQIKDVLTSKSFGSECILPDNFLAEFIKKTGIDTYVLDNAISKETNRLKKGHDGKKKAKLHDFVKLLDAEFAGKGNAYTTTLILTEGDSAATFAKQGLTVIDGRKYGVFPLRGKMINVRDKTKKIALENKEVDALMKIIGLKIDVDYSSDEAHKQLRYGSVLILTDQDMDGSHIKGLILNFFHHFWPSLYARSGFFKTLPTPLLKVWKKADSGKKKIVKTPFYSMRTFEQFVESNDMSKYNVKYYKGLGTHDTLEQKDCFRDFDSRVQQFVYDDLANIRKSIDEQQVSSKLAVNNKENVSNNSMLLAFQKGLEDNRKVWIQNYTDDDVIDNESREILVSDFINKDFRGFSHYNVTRAIPSAIDGLKPSLRKIMFVAFKVLTGNKEFKVEQMGGEVARKTIYHHGEDSLKEAIIGLGQRFPGSNNFNMLNPNGNFGTRLEGGADHASFRYTFTSMNKLTRLLFNPNDNPVLDYKDEEGIFYEPIYYVPILPLVLINGTSGIGTGYSTTVLSYNIKSILANMRSRINGGDYVKMKPWYRRVNGEITEIGDNKYESHGVYDEIDSKTVEIHDLPVGTWTNSYKLFLNKKMIGMEEKVGKGEVKKKEDRFIDDYTFFRYAPDQVGIRVTFAEGELVKRKLNRTLKNDLGLIEKMSSTNMHLFDGENKLRKYIHVEDIMDNFFEVRMETYRKRKEYIIGKHQHTCNIIEWKIRFIEMVHSDEIKMAKIIKGKKIGLSNKELSELLREKGFPELAKVYVYNPALIQHEKADGDGEDAEEAAETSGNSVIPSYSYLTNIKIGDLTEDILEKLRKERQDLLVLLKSIKNKPLEKMWLEDLDEFEREYDKWLIDITELEIEEGKEEGKGNKKGKKTKKQQS